MVSKVRKIIRDTNPQQLEQDILHVLCAAGENVDKESLKIDKLTGGTSNDIFLVKTNLKDKILFRIYGAGSEQFIDRRQELENMKLLSEHGLGAIVVAEFGNGLAYHYINGRSINNTDVISEHIYQLIARKLAKIHQIPVENKQNILWSRMENFIDLVPDFHEDIIGNGMFTCKQALTEEFKFLKNMLEKCDSPLAFCHLDLNLPNILFDGTDVHFIDVEYSGCSHPAFDIANHFVEFVGFEDKKLDYIKWFPSKEFQLAWIRTYYAAMTTIYTEAEVEALFELVQRFVLCSHLMWGAWALVQASVSKIDFDFKDFAQQRLSEYARRKNIVISNLI